MINDITSTSLQFPWIVAARMVEHPLWIKMVAVHVLAEGSILGSFVKKVSYIHIPNIITKTSKLTISYIPNRRELTNVFVGYISMLKAEGYKQQKC